jgi:hypothetical protein
MATTNMGSTLSRFPGKRIILVSDENALVATPEELEASIKFYRPKHISEMKKREVLQRQALMWKIAAVVPDGPDDEADPDDQEVYLCCGFIVEEDEDARHIARDCRHLPAHVSDDPWWVPAPGAKRPVSWKNVCKHCGFVGAGLFSHYNDYCPCAP